MRMMLLAALVLPWLAAGARAANDEYVMLKDQLMCSTQQSLREAMTAFQKRDHALMNTVQGCHYSREGVRAEVLQDNVSMMKIRLGQSTDAERPEYWVYPDSLRPLNRR